MSTPSPVPYLAPWATDWNKYSTQVYKMPMSSTQSASIAVPSSQWWRIIYCTAQYNTLAAAGTRVIALSFNDGLTQPLRLAPSATTPVSTTTFINYGLGLNTVATPIANGDQYLTCALIDLLWKPKTTIAIGLDNAQTGDTLVATPALAVEVYTEFTDADTGTTSLMLTPTLS